MLPAVAGRGLTLVQLLVLLTACLRCSRGLQCYCYESWGVPSADCFFNTNYACNSSQGCYLRRWYSEEDKVIKQTWNCIDDEHGVHQMIDYTGVYCGVWNTADNAYKCCNMSDFCNGNLHIVLDIETSPTPTLQMSISPSSVLLSHPDSHRGSKILVSVIASSLSILLISSLVVILVLVLVRRQWLARHRERNLQKTSDHWIPPVLEVVVLQGNETVSGSQSSPPYQVLSDIKDIVKLSYQIEIGRFGIFYNGFYEGKEVALKKFVEGNHSAWLWESFIYTSVLQPHENILAFVTSAMVAEAANCSPELWLVTKYHEFGSLQDYLRRHVIHGRIFLQMAASMSSGLAYLHSEHSGNQVKVPLAHCNLSSRNIFVKENLSCCIGDFRLAILKHKNDTCHPEDARVGAVRYLAPEILSQPLDTLSFDVFKQGDVYALGLVLWEICQRTHCCGVVSETYQVPFQGLVPPEPTLEDMKKLVVTNKVQPIISKKWNDSKLLREMTKVMRECWYYTSTARPTAVYLKKKLLKMSQEFENIDIFDATPGEGGKDWSGDENCGKLYVSAL